MLAFKSPSSFFLQFSTEDDIGIQDPATMLVCCLYGVVATSNMLSRAIVILVEFAKHSYTHLRRLELTVPLTEGEKIQSEVAELAIAVPLSIAFDGLGRRRISEVSVAPTSQYQCVPRLAKTESY